LKGLSMILYLYASKVTFFTSKQHYFC